MVHSAVIRRHTRIGDSEIVSRGPSILMPIRSEIQLEFIFGRRLQMSRYRGSRFGRSIGASAAVGVAVSFGVAAPAGAEVFDDLVDQAVAPFVDAAAGGVNWDAVWSPAAWDAFFDPAHWDAIIAGSSGAGVMSLQQLIYTPLHAGIEGWINSAGPTPILDGLNDFSKAMGWGAMIADGAAGTEAHPDGGAAGWLFGDGGAGWNSTDPGGAGGAGGAAGGGGHRGETLPTIGRRGP